MLILKPIGRGKWRPMPIEIDERRVPPLFVIVGQRITIGNVVFRISEIRP
ncbi:MAG: hypothetical protein WKG52_00855 [Variovorax sp.]